MGQQTSFVLVGRVLSAVPADAKVFGSTKCSRSDHVGRWLNLDSYGGQCTAPYCSGAHAAEMLFDYDWVRISGKECLTNAFAAHKRTETG